MMAEGHEKNMNNHRRVKEESKVMGLRTMIHIKRWEILGKHKYDGKGY